MITLLNRLNVYLQKTLGLQADTAPWGDSKRLPMLFRNKYDFHFCGLLNAQILLMLAESDNADTPATIKKHVDKVMAISACEVVYVSETIAPHNRNRLIKHKVSFIVPENQMYLPVLGMDLREHIRNVRKPAERTFSPATQAVVLNAIYFRHGVDDYVTPLELAKRLDYTKMTLSRVVDELEATSLVEVRTQWKERRFRFPMGGRQLWGKARPFMRSPTKRTVAVIEPPNEVDCHLAGESALSEYTMLAPPAQPTYAMTTKKWKKLYANRNDEPRNVPEDDVVTIEIWHYLPFNTGNVGCVDPLSLLLSITDVTDERVEAALEELEGKVSW